MTTIRCARCGRDGEGLAEAPFRDELGAEVQEHTCAACWKEWLSFQVKLINEQQLLPVKPEHGAILERNLRAFLELPSAGGASPDEVGAPPA